MLEEIEQTQDTIEEGSTPEVAQEAPEVPQITELDKLEKFKFDNREWTPSEFRNAYLMQQDYTKKTQQLAEERKYYDNLQNDLEYVKKFPSELAKFKSIYPEKFHKYLEYVKPQQGQQYQSIDPEFLERFNRVESELNQKRAEAIDAELDSKFSQLQTKYKYADEESIIARAQSLLEKGEKLTDSVWDALWKQNHDRNQKLAEQYYSDKVKQQKTANSVGKDVAPGGGSPGLAPKTPKTIKEASKYALEELG